MLIYVIISLSVLLVGCDDAQQMMTPVLENLETDDTGLQPHADSPYTGLLHRVGTVEYFGLAVDDPVALEWSGTDFYMVAEYGLYCPRFFRKKVSMATTI